MCLHSGCNDQGSTETGWFKACVVFVLIVIVGLTIAFLITIYLGVAPALSAELTNDSHIAYGMKWTTIKCSPWELRNVWDSRRPGLKGYPVSSMTDFKRKEIWYTDESGLRYETRMIEGGPARWQEEARRDVDGYQSWRFRSIFERW